MQFTGTAGSGKAGGTRRLIRATVIAVLLSTTVGYEPFLMSASAQEFAFSNVVIEGNQRVDAATILAFAGIAKGESISEAGLNDAYQRLVQAGLFETVEMDPQGGTLVIRVTEFPLLNVDYRVQIPAGLFARAGRGRCRDPDRTLSRQGPHGRQYRAENHPPRR